MSNRISLDQLDGMSATAASQLPLDQLKILQDEAADLKARSGRLSAKLNDALDLRFGDAADQARAAKNKDSGIVRIDQQDHQVVADAKKDVKWDQGVLRGIVDTLVEQGKNFADYVTFDIKVSEAKFKAWPSDIQQMFLPARTVNQRRRTYTIEAKGA